MLVAGWILFAMAVVAVVPSTVLGLYRTLRRATQGVADPDNWPLLTVIVPARNEGEQIRAALSSILRCDYQPLEIIAVDDRSTDSTGQVMDQLAAGDPRLSVVHIDTLPADWLGKNHAMHIASERARGEFILFTDGDILFEPNVLRDAVRVCLARDVTHLCLMPRMLPGGLIEQAVTAQFAWTFAVGLQAWLIPTRLSWFYAGIGAFNLVHAATYRQAGGHTVLRLDVLDDVKLGKLMKRNGRRSELLQAGADLAVRWQSSLWNVIRGLEKNAFAALDYSWPKLVLGTLVWSLLVIGPYATVAMCRDARCAGFVGVIALYHLTYAAVLVASRGNVLAFPLFPFASITVVGAFWRSAYITARQGGIRWRETFYPLDLLRRNIYRPRDPD